MARIYSPAEEAERAKTEKARRASAQSLWHAYTLDTMQLDVFTAWHVVFLETPNVALSGLQLALAANWHIADPEDFANQGAFLLTRQDAARLFTLLETTFAACSRSTPHGALSPALVAQLRTNMVNFFRLRAELVLPFVRPSPDTPHAGDVATIARSIVAQYSGVQRVLDYSLQSIAELCAAQPGDPQVENAAFMALVRPFFEAYLRNGMNAQMSGAAIRASISYTPPPFLAAATTEVAAAWALIASPTLALASPSTASSAPATPAPTLPVRPTSPAPDGGSSRGARRPSPGRQRSLPRSRRSPPPRRPDPEALAIPTSRSIIGGVSAHQHSFFKCPVCSILGHRSYECPKAFFTSFGKVLPGHRADGSQDTTAWLHDELVPQARADLAEYLRWTRVPMHRRSPMTAALIAAGP